MVDTGFNEELLLVNAIKDVINLEQLYSENLSKLWQAETFYKQSSKQPMSNCIKSFYARYIDNLKRAVEDVKIKMENARKYRYSLSKTIKNNNKNKYKTVKFVLCI